MSALFFSRGRGSGHAIPDMAIADDLAALEPDIHLRFVSYGTGASTLAAHGRALIDLDLPDRNPVWETLIRCAALLGELQPDLVISHEEFVALVAARMTGIPAVFITEWFGSAEDPQTQTLAYADEIVFIEEEGIFDEPPYIEGKVYYAGPVLREFAYGRRDRDRARQELGIPQDAITILVAPGGWATEEREPIAELLMPAFDALKSPRKRLVWLAGTDYELLNERFGGRPDVLVKERDWQIDRLMVASDMAITKANRVTLRELAALGIPSISISHGHNRIDDALIERLETNTPLDARTAHPRMLATAMREALNRARYGVPGELDGAPPRSDGARLAAQRIAHHIDRARAARGVASLARIEQ